MDEQPTPGITGDDSLRLTYAEIAARIGASPDAARQLVRRKGWQRIMPNRKGAPAVIVVPADELQGEQWRQDRPTPPVISPGDRPTPPDTAARFDVALKAIESAHAIEVKALLALTESLREQLADVRTHLADAKADKARTEQQVTRLEADLAAANARAGRLLAEVEAMRSPDPTQQAPQEPQDSLQDCEVPTGQPTAHEPPATAPGLRQSRLRRWLLRWAT
jgi:hypothetical protein